MSGAGTHREEFPDSADLSVQFSRSLQNRLQISEISSGVQKAVGASSVTLVSACSTSEEMLGSVHHTTPWLTCLLASNLPQELNLRLPSAPCHQLAGRTAFSLDNWSKITGNQWFLDAVAGYRLEPKSSLRQTNCPIVAQQCQESKELCIFFCSTKKRCLRF